MNDIKVTEQQASTLPTQAKLGIGRRDTRWDVYPGQEPKQLIAHSWQGFFAWSEDVGWYKTTTSFVVCEWIVFPLRRDLSA